MNKENETRVRHAITRLLARREHGYEELVQKLSGSGFDEIAIHSQLDQFRDADLQSDHRFAEMHLRNCYQKGQGPSRIRQKLSFLKVEDEVISAVMNESTIDWYQLAYQVKVKKFGVLLASDNQAKAKQQQFLSYRGFSSDQVQHALTSKADS